MVMYGGEVMWGGIGIDVIRRVMRMTGVGVQLSLRLHVPKYEISEEYLVHIGVEYRHNDGGMSEECKSGLVCGVDHPAFVAMKRELVRGGYVREEAWLNGDVVLKEFELNGVRFVEGDRFMSAGAMKGYLEERRGE